MHIKLSYKTKQVSISDISILLELLQIVYAPEDRVIANNSKNLWFKIFLPKTENEKLQVARYLWKL